MLSFLHHLTSIACSRSPGGGILSTQEASSRLWLTEDPYTGDCDGIHTCCMAESITYYCQGVDWSNKLHMILYS
jgi:hypothetical protein